MPLLDATGPVTVYQRRAGALATPESRAAEARWAAEPTQWLHPVRITLGQACGYRVEDVQR